MVDATLAGWLRSYPEAPDRDAPPSKPELTTRYRPPQSDARGIAIALTIIATWHALFIHGCWQVKLPGAGGRPASPWWDILGTFFALEFINTGLFITGHDAMHGTLSYKCRRLNDALGAWAVSLYAWFDYKMLHRNHWLHHQNTGQPHKDPDFHRGNPWLPVWFFHFMCEYSSLLQFAKILLVSQVLQVLGVPYANLCLYMAAAPILSALRLFYFGTYLPHLPPNATEIMSWQKSHSVNLPGWASFLQCYHFGLHYEHHKWPYAPWWQLPQLAKLTRAAAAAAKEAPQQQQEEQAPALAQASKQQAPAVAAAAVPAGPGDEQALPAPAMPAGLAHQARRVSVCA